MHTGTTHAPDLDSSAALSAILALARAGLGNHTTVARPTGEQSVIDRSRALLSARRDR
jgi:hypothetical protein